LKTKNSGDFFETSLLLKVYAQLLMKWKKPLVGFLIGQPALQLVNLVIGFLLLRWLSVEHYAQFGVAFAFQSTVTMLADLGFASSVLALAGERARDPEVLGKYLKAAQYFRIRLSLIVLVIFGVCFPWIVAGQAWDGLTKAIMFGSIAFAVLVQGWSMYSAPLLAHREVAKVYRPQVAAGALRLVCCGLLHLAQMLNGLWAAWIGSLALGFSGWWTRRLARPWVNEPVKADPAVRREMVRYLAPLMPGVIFTAFQSQISLAIITLLGTTQNVAEVAALGRLGQLFGILAAFNGVIIGPYIAALPAIKLRKRYFQFLGAAIVVAAVLSLLSFLFPDPLLWLLGPHYRALRGAVGWVVLTGCLSYVGGVMWTMHSARKWVYWWSSFCHIGLLVIIQILAVVYLNLSTTMGVVYFGVITAATVLLVHIATAIVGLKINNI
jgi:O-antigen/teichoic acid export membrane protein